MADGQAGGDSLADHGGRDGDFGHLDPVDAAGGDLGGGCGEGLAIVAGARDDGQAGGGEDALGLVPGGQAGELVGAEDEPDVRVGVGGGEGLQRVGGVAGPGAVELQARDGEAGAALDGPLEPGQPPLGGAVGALGLVGRKARRDEEQAVEAQLPQRLAREDQVAEVRRVEGAAEDSEAAWRGAAGGLSGRARPR